MNLQKRNRYPVGLLNLVKANSAKGKQIVCGYDCVSRAGTIADSGIGPNGPYVTIFDLGKDAFRTLSLKKMRMVTIL